MVEEIGAGRHDAVWSITSSSDWAIQNAIPLHNKQNKNNKSDHISNKIISRSKVIIYYMCALEHKEQDPNTDTQQSRCSPVHKARLSKYAQRSKDRNTRYYNKLAMTR